MANRMSRSAVRIKQGSRVIYAASFTVADFKRPNFYRVDKLDARKNSGYQRYLDEKRAKRISKDLIDAWRANNALFLPTSLFLATNNDIKFAKGKIEFNIDDVCPFDIVDGQHRIGALIEASKSDPKIESFPILVNIASSLEDVHQMLHFFTINTKQKAVDASLANNIIARFTDMDGFSNIPHLPNGLKREVKKRTILKAVELTRYLNDDRNSPWHGRIAVENAPPKKGEVKSSAMESVIKKFVVTPNNPISYYDKDKGKKILVNYWRAIVSLLVPSGKENETVVLKDNGLWFFHFVSAMIITWLMEKEDFTVNTIKTKLKSVFENLDESELATIANPEWWLTSKKDKKSDGGAGRLNRSSLLNYAKKFNDAVTFVRQKERGGKKMKL